MRELRTLRIVVVGLVLGSCWGSRGDAGGLPTPGQTGPLFTQYGSGNGTGSGDYISASIGNGGLNSPYHYYVEVPPGLPRLVVDIFDADINNNGDLSVSGFNTSARYTLRDPTGATQATLTGNNAGPGNNAWTTLYDSSTVLTAPTFGAVTTNAVAGNNTSITSPVPAGTVANDFLLVSVTVDGNALISASAAGWTQIDQAACSNNNCRMAVFGRYATASEPASYAFTWTGNQEAVAIMLRYSGVTGTISGFTSGNNTGNSAAPQAPSITAPSNAMVVRLYGADTSTASGTPYPTGTNGRGNLASSATTNAVTSGAADLVQSGTTGTASFAITATHRWRAVTVALPGPPGPPLAGHWELEVNTTSAVTGGSDNDGFGIRAHDGNLAGGTELNVYADSQVILGPIGASGNSAAYTLYPYVTSGCSLAESDFDFDSDLTPNPTQSIVYSSRSGGFTQTIAAATLSTNDNWITHTIPTAGRTWTTSSDAAAVDYGIWTQQTTISGFPGGAANYGILYTGSFRAALAPPSASPEANTFRQYLPTNAGTAPVKPYLEQLLTWVSGPATPTVGQATVLSVTVRLVNPTPYAITFGGTGSNVVTVNVPGPTTAVTYQGNVQVTQGSVTTQPAVGGIGNVVWNPGSVAANTNAVLLAFRVRITPTSAGQRIPVTGVVSAGTGANGTRAQFVDETGNATQARATMLLGPICELAATVSSITPAVVASVHARAGDQGVEVEWDTASEVGTVGFDVLRWDAARKEYVTLNDRLLAGLQGSPQGGHYRFLDEGASRRGTYWYVVSEVTSSGERHFHGPFQVSVEPEGTQPKGTASTAGYDRTPRKAPAAFTRALAARRAGILGGRPAPRIGAAALKIGVERTGLYFVPTESIASDLGMRPEQITALLRASQLSLSSQGRAVAWAPVPGGLLFYGQAIDSIYTRDNVYWLRLGPGLVMSAVDGRHPGAVGAESFTDEVHAEENHLAATVLSTDPDADYWYWDFLSGGDPSLGDKTFTITALDPDPTGGPGRLRARFLGGTATGVSGEHHAVVSLNGSPVGDVQWEGLAPAVLDVAVSPALIHAGANSIRIQALLDSGAPYSFFFVDNFDLAYDRQYQADGDALAFRGGGHGVVTVDGFSTAAISVFDLGDPSRPRRVSRSTIDGAAGRFRVSLVPSGPDTTYLAATQASWLAPKWTRPYRPSGLKASARGADYLIVTTADLLVPARRLAALREKKGLRTAVVDIADVMDDFSFGISDPRAIRAFLRWTGLHGSSGPHLVLLAGAGTFDYKDYLGYGGNLIPPVMVSTPSGLFASDNSLADFDGDGLPEIGIGRLPVVTASDFDAYVGKLEAYQASDGAGWDDHALWVADRTSSGGDFAGQAESLVPQLSPGYTTERIYLSDGGIAATRALLMNGLNTGASLMNYVGHGGLDRLSADGILVSSDAPNLTNGERMPLLTALTCVINRFEVPGFSSLGSELLKSPNGGFSAVWAPTGLSVDQDALVLGGRFFSGLAARPDAPIGDIVRDALRSYGGAGRDPSLGRVYNLLGDPGLVLKGPPPVPASPSTSGSSSSRRHPTSAGGPT
jgi:Peptidase family C25